MIVKIELPDELFQEFLQAARDFEQRHQDALIKISADLDTGSTDQVDELLNSITPPLGFMVRIPRPPKAG